MSKNRAPNTTWSLRGPGKYPNGGAMTTDDDRIVAYYVETTDGQYRYQSIALPRADARLLAKRINQCLDETRKR